MIQHRLASSLASSTWSSSSSSATLSSFLTSAEARWAAGGWAFFVAENFILSENRTYLISEFGDETYHAAYGTLSTAAVASIMYSYNKLRKIGNTAGGNPTTTTMMRNGMKNVRPGIGNALASWCLLSAGLIMSSQALPKMQIPFLVVAPDGEETDPLRKQRQGQEKEGGSDWKVQVRCPFDFADNKSNKSEGGGGGGGGDDDAAAVRGLDRVSRHPGLWSLSFLGLSRSVAWMSASPALSLWYAGPTAVALLGGAHTDSRYRRNMGGSMNPHYECQTSNVPFVAMITGKQGRVSESFLNLIAGEIKPLNAVVATTVATAAMLIGMRRGRPPYTTVSAAAAATKGKAGSAAALKMAGGKQIQ